MAVPYAEKEQAKALGAKWDPSAKSWYDPGPEINAQLDKWLKDPSTPMIVAPVLKVAERKYLKVPYANKDEAKSLGLAHFCVSCPADLVCRAIVCNMRIPATLETEFQLQYLPKVQLFEIGYIL